MTDQVSLSSILLIEDSADDYEAILRAFEEAHLNIPVLWCRTGDEALRFLGRTKKDSMKRRTTCE